MQGPQLFASKTCSACTEALRFVNSRPDILAAIQIKFVDDPKVHEEMMREARNSTAVPTLVLDGHIYRGAHQIRAALLEEFGSK